MLTLFLAVFIALFISAACSLTETVLYSVPWAHIEKLRKKGSKAGELLYEMRCHVDKPIAAVLTLNTVANTAGSSIAGAAFVSAFGIEYMAIFAGIFTVLILAFGEILPKTIGVSYAAPCSTVIAYPLSIIVKILTPIIWLTSRLTRLIAKSSTPKMSEDDIRAVASLSRKAGSIAQYEERYIRNILALDTKRVYDVMTPRTVVFSLPQETTVRQAWENPQSWHFSRIPVYDTDRENVVGLIQLRTLGQYMTAADKSKDTALKDIMRPIRFVPESKKLDELLHEMLNSKGHLFGVLDEYGGLAGVVSLEDVLEDILGHEIVDESDTVENLQELARHKRVQSYAAQRKNDKSKP